jgi:lia operon protein LiaG
MEAQFKEIYKFLTVAVFSILLLNLNSCQPKNAHLVSKEIDEKFSGIEVIEIEGAFMEVFYEGSDDVEEVSMTGFYEVSENLDLSINYRQSGNKLKIQIEKKDWFFGFVNIQQEGFLSLKGPKNMRLDIQANSGTVDVQSVNSDRIRLTVNSGMIKVQQLDVDDIHFQASSGKIEGSDIIGSVYCKVNSGSIKIKNVIGNVEAEASSGIVNFVNVQGKLNAKVNSGTIKLEDVTEVENLKISSGIAKVMRSGFGNHPELNGNSGTIQIQTTADLNAYNYQLKASSGSVQVGNRKSNDELNIYNNAQNTITGKISSGSIKIYN